MKRSMFNRLMFLGISICLLSGVTGCGQNNDETFDDEQSNEASEQSIKAVQEDVAEASDSEGADESQSESEGQYTEFEVKNLGMTFFVASRI